MSYYNGKRIADGLGTHRKKKTYDGIFTLEAGRTIVLDGKPLFYLQRIEENILPVRADEFAKTIVRLLNKAVK